MKVKTIKQKAIVPATPSEVYDALIDAEKHSAFTGSKATCDPRVGGEFTVWADIFQERTWSWRRESELFRNG